jgi:hypothetical protein
MISNLTYNRSKKVYEVARENETVEFPAGIDGKRKAFQLAVYSQNPRLYRFVSELAGKYPLLASRAWKSAEIVLNGGVLRINDNGVLAMVASQSSEFGDHNLTAVDGLIMCDCIDYTGQTAPFIGGNFQRACKHYLAYQLALRLEKRKCYHCQALVDAQAEYCTECGGLVTPF